MSAKKEAATTAEDCGTVMHDRKWQRLRLARAENDEDEEKTRRLEIRHISDVPGLRLTLRRHLDSRLRGGTPAKSDTPNPADGATRYSLPPVLTPERHAVVRWKRAKWNHSLAVKQRRRDNKLDAAASIVSFWKKRTPESQKSRTRTASAEEDGDMAVYRPWNMVWTRSALCETCGERVSVGRNMLGCAFCNQVAHRSCQIRDVELHIATLCGEILQQIDEDKGDKGVRAASMHSPETVGGGDNWVCRHCLDAARPAMEKQPSADTSSADKSGT